MEFKKTGADSNFERVWHLNGAEIIELFRQGNSQAKICRMMNVSRKTMRDFIRRHGIAIELEKIKKGRRKKPKPYRKRKPSAGYVRREGTVKHWIKWYYLEGGLTVKQLARIFETEEWFVMQFVNDPEVPVCRPF